MSVLMSINLTSSVSRIKLNDSPVTTGFYSIKDAWDDVYFDMD